MNYRLLNILIPKNLLSYSYFFVILLAANMACKSVKIPKATHSLQIAFYNVENLFDTIPDPNKRDNDFTPDGKLAWNTERYFKKIKDLATVIDSMGTPDMIGLAEVENDLVLKDLIRQLKSKGVDFEMVHYDSPDERGIDVALLFKPSVFRQIADQRIPVQLDSDTVAMHTRDILYVALVEQKYNDTFHVFVNHWPSRVGGKEKSEPKRMTASSELKSALENMWAFIPTAHIIIMGDFNDNPTDSSILSLLKTNHPTESQYLLNLSIDQYQRGIGSYNYRGNWDMLDQIITSSRLLSLNHVKSADFQVFNRNFLLFEHHQYGKSPNRTYGGPNYYGGYSDHLPVKLTIRYK
jgi:predicted extracellular nuclease